MPELRLTDAKEIDLLSMGILALYRMVKNASTDEQFEKMSALSKQMCADGDGPWTDDTIGDSIDVMINVLTKIVEAQDAGTATN